MKKTSMAAGIREVVDWTRDYKKQQINEYLMTLGTC